MSSARPVSVAEFLDVLHDFDHTAFRLELQPAYAVPDEAPLCAAFLRGEATDPMGAEYMRDWYAQIREHARAGKQVERVRVHEEPPTDYQRFERWLDHWNIAAGEVMRYLTRQQAHDIGLLPDAGSTDWWLLDSSRLLLMHFDSTGHRNGYELTTDYAAVAQACAWRDLAVHHSTPAIARGVAA